MYEGKLVDGGVCGEEQAIGIIESGGGGAGGGDYAQGESGGALSRAEKR